MRSLDLLREDSSLAPTDNLHRWEPILMDHAEAFISLVKDFLAWMFLEAEENFKERSCD